MILHVACLPFPTHQGTQAAIASMLEASVRTGRPARLLAYAHCGYALDTPYRVDRVPDFPKVRSLRSGPSWGKVALDARCVLEIRRLVKAIRPDAIVAHHIEAACAALAARVAPVLYVVHTDLERELPIYFRSLPPRLVGAAARSVDARVRARAAGIAAVSPMLAKRLGPQAIYLPVPWPPRPGRGEPSRAEARSALEIPRDVPVCLYAGNLDRYQGWEHLVEALAVSRRFEPTVRLLIATESDPHLVHREAARAGLGDAVDVRPLAGEPARARAHAASDLAWIPRRTEGGLPIKMLDAFARGVPVVAMERAAAGLSIENASILVPNDDGAALARAGLGLLRNSGAATALAAKARHYLATRHSIAAFTRALDRLLHRNDAAARERPHERRRPEVPAPRAR